MLATLDLLWIHWPSFIVGAAAMLVWLMVGVAVGVRIGRALRRAGERAEPIIEEPAVDWQAFRCPKPTRTP